MLQTLAGILIKDDALAIDPLPHGRRLRFDGVEFRGRRYEIDAVEGGATFHER